MMFEINTSDPGLVTVSTAAYRLLLWGYPAPFRGEYGGQMAQVFRDGCLKAYRQRGVPGLLKLWAFTLIDWFKTVIEERFNRRTEMTREKFIRLSGWGWMVGAVSVFFATYLTEPGAVRAWMYRAFGAPITQDRFEIFRVVYQNLGNWLLLAGFSLFVLGAAGLRLHDGGQTGSWGKHSLFVSMLGGGMAGVAVLMGFVMLWEVWWLLVWFGLVFFSGGLLIYGLAALKVKAFALENGLPVLAGIGFPLATILAILYRVIQGQDWQPGQWMMHVLLGVTLGSLFWMGYLLQKPARNNPAATS